MEKVLIIGNLGYIGPVLNKSLKEWSENIEIIGYDTGYFEGCLINNQMDCGIRPSQQYYGDVRSFNEECLKGVSTVIYLAAISNDPMGNLFEKQTIDINAYSASSIALKACKMGVKKFIFASSCSTYGFGGANAKNENDTINPLTAYAKSKVQAEVDLKKLASTEFLITCLRFATACGPSPRLRLDLVLNDFVVNALINGKIEILSDGSPLRPLIDVRDMAKAFIWASKRSSFEGGDYLVVNAGSNDWNFSVGEIAKKVNNVFPEVSVSVSPNAQPDKRSYKVDFSLFSSLSGDFYPKRSLEDSILDIANCIRSSSLDLTSFRDSNLMRLNTLIGLQKNGRLNKDLFWK